MVEIIIAAAIGALLFKLIMDRREKNNAIRKLIEKQKDEKDKG